MNQPLASVVDSAPLPSISASQVRDLAAALVLPRQQIETAFVSVGSRLTDGAAMLGALTKLFEALPDVLQGADVAEASAHLEAVSTKARELSETFAREKLDLARLVEVVGAASAPIADLYRTVKMMGIVSINAGVTAAGILADGEEFDVFTNDISKLSDSAGRTIQEFSQVYRQLTGEVARAVEQRAHFERSHAHTLSTLGESLSRTIVALDEQRRMALAGSAETGRVSRQIVGRIGSAVMALQVGDSTRQRIEHIESALAALADILAGDAVAGQTLTPALHAEAVAAIAALEQAQLSQTGDTFAAEVGEAEVSLKALADDAGMIMAHSQQIYGSSGPGQASALASLASQLRAAVVVLKDCEAERAELETVAHAVQSTVKVLLGHVEAVQDIEANMRLVSLNAAVRCAQLGPRGASLTVIATQLRELTTETVVAAKAAITRLDESSTLASAFSAAATGEAAGQIGRLEQQANLALTLLSGLDKRLAAALESLNADGPRVIRELGAAASGILGQADIAEVMQDLALQIAALSTEPPPETPAQDLAAILEWLRSLYTMEAERSIHTALFGEKPGTASEAEAGASDDLDDFML